MEDNGGFNGISNNTVRKKRSLTSRRPRPAEASSTLFPPPSHHFTNISSDDDIPAFDTNPRRRRKDFSLTHCISRAAESQRGNHDSLRIDVCNGIKGADLGQTKRLKLKIGGVTRLLHANASSPRPVNDTTNSNHLEGSSDDCHSPLDNKADLEGDESMTGRRKQVEPSGSSVRKSKRVPKKRVFDGYDDNDDEIQFLEKPKYRSVSLFLNEETESCRRQLKLSGITNAENSGKKKTAFEEASEYMDYAEELESVPEDKETGDDIKRESTLTSRQRALASASGKSSAIEFPDGLPPTTSRRKKENVSEMEQQLKKAEAAQRRKVQVEKAARESEAEAIRKILGQDSSRKKREDKNKKRLDELAQERAAHEERASTSYIRTIMGPNGTTVSFPIGKVPSLFDPKPSGYPPPRENCAGPSCTNPFKYRDSKTKVPLCSLKCYKAVQQQHQTPPV
ncbi:unnamed protein product [Eruca vesicaria subsp. sativa]|uniref:INO80 complex subunit B-like conserved region domain-containing protein n=1 Tax=Eruca vesicaria subsp. sativa TaxID=29727 RepID=A0ABC8IZU2_ERUVS|nr:unnamed protein product [Eruca vesicaria subsp. sativa]